MLDELRRLASLSRHTRAKLTLVRRATAALERKLSRCPTVHEVAALIGLSAAAVSQFEALAAAVQQCSVHEAELEGEGSPSLVDRNAVCPARSAETGDTYTSLHLILDQLPSNHARVLCRYYLEEATLDDIAEELGISKGRVRQIREADEKSFGKILWF